MSVTNGERLATKQDLADMYQGILPYLGGMPEMLANKFSKGDLYSTDEKMIGQWVDGKPVYQKVAILESSLKCPRDTWTNTTVQYSNIDKMLGGYVIDNYGQSLPCCIGFNSSAGVLAIEPYNGATNVYIDYIVYCYTKTTDTAISIGSDTDYSTEEKIVGTWIDGTPVWQKTFNIGALPNKTTKTTNIDIQNIDSIINFWGIAIENGNATFTMPAVRLTNLAHGIECYIDIASTPYSIKVNTGNVDRSSANGYVTIQYTKTTGT